MGKKKKTAAATESEPGSAVPTSGGGPEGGVAPGTSPESSHAANSAASDYVPPEGESIRGYFTKLLKSHRSWVTERSNTAIFDQWLKDHPGHTEVPKQVKQGLSNIKSVFRSKLRKHTKKR